MRYGPKHIKQQRNFLLQIRTARIIWKQWWQSFSLDHRPRDGHGFTPHHSFERIRNPGYKATERTAKTFKHSLVKPGRNRSSSWRYSYANICHYWFLYITSSFVWVYLHVICGRSFLSPFTLDGYPTSLDCRCLGEVRGGAKMDELQTYHHKWPPQKNCHSYLALCALPIGCTLHNDSGSDRS